MYTNIDTFNNKRTEFEARISLNKPDVNGLTEINPKNARWSLESQDLQLNGYTLYDNRYGRGVALYVKDSIRSVEVNMTTSHTVSAWCEVALKDNDKLLVGEVYTV